MALVLLLVATAFLAPKPGSAESLTSDAAAQSRIAAAEATEPAKTAPDAAPSDPPQKSGGVNNEPPSRGLDGRARYRALIEKETAHVSLSPEIAEAVMAVESGFDPGTIGSSGEIGLMQVLPSTARMLGFTGELTELAAPEINIHYGVTYLAQAWRLAGGDLCTAVMKYRAGHGETRFSNAVGKLLPGCAGETRRPRLSRDRRRSGRDLRRRARIAFGIVVQVTVVVPPELFGRARGRTA